MKVLKLSVICILATLTVLAACAFSSSVCFKNAESYSFYCGDSSKNCKEITADSSPAIVKLALKNVCGESATYTKFNLEKFLASVSGEIIFSETLSDSVNYYCKANLPYKVNLYGKEINLHICIRKDSVKVGSPIIFGGY